MNRLRQALKHQRRRHELYGAPVTMFAYPYWLLHDRRQWGPVGTFITRSRRIPGWTRGAEAVALAQASLALPPHALIVEIGSCLGGSAVLLAGARKLRGSGHVHCVDPFDASGDAFSVPVYRALAQGRRLSLRAQFDGHLRRAGLSRWVTAHQGRASDIAAGWHAPIDMLYLDGDQSYAGVRAAYQSWRPFLKRGGLLALHNSHMGPHAPDHDGHFRLVLEALHPPDFSDVRCIGTTTFARVARAWPPADVNAGAILTASGAHG